MRIRLVPELLFALALLAPSTGCVSMPWSGSSTPPGLTGPSGLSEPAEKPATLPANEAAKANLHLAESLDQNGHPAEAIAYYERARQADPKHSQDITRRLAVLNDQVGNTEKALAEYEAALKTTPRDADLLNSVGYFHYTRGKFADAEKCLRTSLDLNPKNRRAWVNLGLTLGQLNRYDESLAAFEKGVGKAEASSNLGFLFTTQGKRDQARMCYQRALNIDPNLRIARLALQRLDGPPPPSAAKGAEPFTPPPSAAPAPRPTAQAPPPDLSNIIVPPPGSPVLVQSELK